jgi:ketosteroid isomerase-like protein
MKKIVYLMLMAGIIITACQPKTVSIDVSAEADAIRNLENQWTAAIQTKDVEKIMSLKAPEVVTMVPNIPAVIGLDNNRKRMETSWIDTSALYETYSTTIDIIEVSSSGDLAYVRGTDRISIKTQEGTDEDVSKYVDIWKKIDGQWKNIVSIWNSDKPLEGQ